MSDDSVAVETVSRFVLMWNIIKQCFSACLLGGKSEKILVHSCLVGEKRVGYELRVMDFEILKEPKIFSFLI